MVRHPHGFRRGISDSPPSFLGCGFPRAMDSLNHRYQTCPDPAEGGVKPPENK